MSRKGLNVRIHSSLKECRNNEGRVKESIGCHFLSHHNILVFCHINNLLIPAELVLLCSVALFLLLHYSESDGIDLLDITHTVMSSNPLG